MDFYQELLFCESVCGGGGGLNILGIINFFALTVPVPTLGGRKHYLMVATVISTGYMNMITAHRYRQAAEWNFEQLRMQVTQIETFLKFLLYIAKFCCRLQCLTSRSCV